MKKAFKALKAIVRNPWLLNKVLSDDSVWNKYLKKNHPEFQSLPILDLGEIDPKFSQVLSTFAFLGGGSLPTDIALLKMLAEKYVQCSYFEIGTWRGESVVNVADVASDCYTLCLHKKEILEKGASESYADVHEFFSKRKENITHLKGNSMNFDFAGLNKKFDLIFIDGNHHYDYAKNDTQKVFEHLVHDNSIVVWHDCAYSPEKQRPEVISAILDGVPSKIKNNIYHVGNTLCAVYIKGDFETTDLKYPVYPKKKFVVKVEQRDL